MNSIFSDAPAAQRIRGVEDEISAWKRLPAECGHSLHVLSGSGQVCPLFSYLVRLCGLWPRGQHAIREIEWCASGRSPPVGRTRADHDALTSAGGAVRFPGAQSTFPAMKQARAKRRAACAADVQKFCGDIEPGKGGRQRCLRSHRAEISPECKSARQELRVIRANEKR